MLGVFRALVHNLLSALFDLVSGFLGGSAGGVSCVFGVLLDSTVILCQRGHRQRQAEQECE
jgi:hypothetical protein